VISATGTIWQSSSPASFGCYGECVEPALSIASVFESSFQSSMRDGSRLLD